MDLRSLIAGGGLSGRETVLRKNVLHQSTATSGDIQLPEDQNPRNDGCARRTVSSCVRNDTRHATSVVLAAR